MAHLLLLLVLMTISFPKRTLSVHEDNPLTIFLKEKPYKLEETRIRLSIEQVESEIEELNNTQLSRAVVVTNAAEFWLRIFCSSEYDHVFDNQRVDILDSVLFKFKPIPSSEEEINFQCGVDYARYYAIWDVTNDMLQYYDEEKRVQHYIIRHDGIYIDNVKIHGLISYENRYLLCKENYVKDYYPDCIPGYVSSDMCNNLPAWMLNKVSLAKVQDYGCIILYDDYNCAGSSKEVNHQPAINYLQDFKNRTVSVKGCAI